MVGCGLCARQYRAHTHFFTPTLGLGISRPLLSHLILYLGMSEMFIILLVL